MWKASKFISGCITVYKTLTDLALANGTSANKPMGNLDISTVLICNVSLNNYSCP